MRTRSTTVGTLVVLLVLAGCAETDKAGTAPAVSSTHLSAAPATSTRTTPTATAAETTRPATRRPPAPLPPGTTPADRATLIGRWEVVSSNGRGDHADGYVDFARTRLRGHDGCNEFTGVRWSVGPDGAFRARGGGSTAKLCRGSSLLMAAFLTQPGIGRLGLVQGRLVAYGPHGKELGRLARS